MENREVRAIGFDRENRAVNMPAPTSCRPIERRAGECQGPVGSLAIRHDTLEIMQDGEARTVGVNPEKRSGVGRGALTHHPVEYRAGEGQVSVGNNSIIIIRSK